MKPKVLYVFRTKRKPILEAWQQEKTPDSMLFGLNHLRKLGYRVDLYDFQYSFFNPFHWLFYPLERSIINQVGMGFKIDQAVSLLPLIKSYDVIILSGDSCGLPFLWLKHLGLIKKPVIYLSACLVGALKANLDSWVIDFYKKIFSAADILTTYSAVEFEYFQKKMKLAESKLRLIPYCTDWSFFSKHKYKGQNFIAAAGVDTSRDYKTFFKAVASLNVKVKLACRRSNLSGLDIPENVEIKYRSYPEIRQLFGQARLVVVPLLELGRSAGQMVVLEAGSAKAPLLVSKVSGITTAFKFESKKHLLYAKPESALSLRRQIKFLYNNPSIGKKMGNSISTLIKNNYTTGHLAKYISSFIEKLV